MRADTYYMLSFESTHEAIAAQRRFKDRVPVCVMPTLRAVQAGCGISLRVEAQDAKKLKAAIPNGLEAAGGCFGSRVEPRQRLRQKIYKICII